MNLQNIKLVLLGSVSFFLSFLFGGQLSAQSTDQHLAEEITYYRSSCPFTFPTITLPSINNRSYDIRDFGAKTGIGNLCTKAIQTAIDRCEKDGGGHVIIPSGLWITGPLELKSNVDLHTERGALVLFSANHADFPLIPVGGGKKKNYFVMPPLFGRSIKNASITGQGVFDGNGQSWRPVKKDKMTLAQWKALLASGYLVDSKNSIAYPSENALRGAANMKLIKADPNSDSTAFLALRDYLRPKMLIIQGGKDILIDGVSIINAPNFAINPSSVIGLVIHNVKVNNEWWAQNGDGIDLSSCKNAMILDCVVNAGDDGICMKSSGKSHDGNAQLSNIIIAGNTVYHAHGGFVIGSNTDGGMQNIWVKNCCFLGTDRGLRIKSAAGRGGDVGSVYIDSIAMNGITGESILFDTQYSEDNTYSDKTEDSRIPYFHDFYISHVYASGANQGIIMNAIGRSRISDIRFTDVMIDSKTGSKFKNASNVSLKGCLLKCEQGDVLSKSSCDGFVEEP